MATENEKTFTESEHLAVLADRVKAETASLTAEVETLKAERDEARNLLDAAESAKVAAEQRAEKAEKDFESFKVDLESLREAADRKDDRIAKVKEVASHLEDAFFEDAERVDRIVAMTEESFGDYLSILKDSAPAAGVQKPRETAMSGSSATTTTVSAGRAFLLGGALPKEA